MKNLREMKAKRGELVNEARSLVDNAEEEKRELTEEEEGRFRSLMEEVDSRGVEIDREERLQTLEAMRDIPRYEEPDGEFKSIGEFLNAVRFKPADPRLLREQSVGTGSEGGYLVPPQYSTQLLTVSAQEAIVRPRATVIPADPAEPDATLYMPAIDYSEGRYGGVSVSWISEAAAKPETDATFAQVDLAPKEVAAHIIVSDKLIQNYAAAETVLGGLLRGAIVAAEDTAFLNGAVGGPTGIIGHASNVAIPRTTADEIAYADIVEMFASVKFGGSLVWAGSQTTLPQLMQMEDTGGHLIWQPNAVDNSPGTLLGLPFFLNERSPVLGTEGDLVLADLSYYLVKDGYGLAVSASEHVYFTSNKTVIKAFRRVDGEPWLTAPLTLEDGETEVSPFVVLSDVAS